MRRTKSFLMRVLCIAVVALVALGVSARDTEYGVEVGFLRNELVNETYDSKGGNGFIAGVFVKHSFDELWSLNSGLTFEMKAGEVWGDNMRFEKIKKVKYNQINYLTVPMTVSCTIRLDDDWSLNPNAGIYGAVGVGGTAYQEGIDVSGRPYSGTYPTFGFVTNSPYMGCQPYDGGLTAGLDIRYKDFGVKLAWEQSMFHVIGTGHGMNQSWIAGVRYYIF